MDANAIELAYPLSPLQQGILFHSELTPDHDPYVVQQTYRLTGELNVEAFRAAWRMLVARHAALRTAFVWKSQRAPLQVVMREVDAAPVVHEWSHLDDAAFQRQWQALCEEERARGFALTKPPAARLVLVRAADSDYLIKTYHHIITDGWSSSILVAELASAYASIDRGESPQWPPVRPYREYVRWLDRQDKQVARAYWRRTLAGYEGRARLSLPAPRERDGTARIERELNDEATSKLDADARRFGVTVNTLVQAAWAITLSRYGGERDVVVGATVSGRPSDLPSSDRMVGLFINTVPVRSVIEKARPLAQWLSSLQQQLAESQQFSFLPLTDIIDGGARAQELFESLIVFENFARASASARSAGSLRVERLNTMDGTHYPITLYVMPGSRLRFRVWFQRRRYRGSDIERVLTVFLDVLSRLGAEPDGLLGGVSDLPASERAYMAGWNQTAHRVDYDRSVLARWQDRLDNAPTDTAVEFQDAADGWADWTANEVERRANALARALIEAGGTRASRIGLMLPHGRWSLVAMLAVWKVGAAYVPMDPAYPLGRLQYIADDAALDAVLVSRASGPDIDLGDTNTLVIEDIDWSGAYHRVDAGCLSDAVAYSIYTSGSTGRPKAVDVTHANLINFLTAMQATLRFTSGERWLAITSLSFDIAVLELLLPLLNGGTVVVAGPRTTHDPHALTGTLRERRIDWMQATPATWQLLFESGWSGDHRLSVLSGGEAIALPLAQSLAASTRRAINVYGPTETTIWSSLHVFEPSVERVSIGQPIANTALHVVDPHGDPLPIGAIGELAIAGAGVASGYRNRPGLTASRFVPDAESTVPGARMYLTGDLARWCEDGTVECLGRADHQVKLRGHRIELGEVEAALLTHSAVRQAVVRCQPVAGEMALVGYVVLDEHATEPASERALVDGLRKQLPTVMIPSVIETLDALPLTPNLKVDRAALTPSGSTDVQRRPWLSPTESLLATLWEELLGRAVGLADESFFDLGGHSLLVMRLSARILEAFGTELSLASLFEHSTLRDQAELIDEATRDVRFAAPISRAPSMERYPLSFEQQRLWFLYELGSDVSAFHLPIGVRLSGDVDVERLRWAFSKLVERHDMLRVRFPRAAGQPYQVLDAPHPELTVVDVDDDDALGLRMHRVTEEAFDLAQSPPVRAVCYRHAADELTLLIVVHHIAADGWALGRLLEDFAEQYRALSSARTLASPTSLGYIDYALWQRETLPHDAFAQDIDYWREQLADLPTLTLSGGPLSSPPMGTGRARFNLSPRLSETLRELGRREHATLFMVLLASWKVLLGKYFGQADICVGTVVANRQRRELGPIVGTFVNTLAMRTNHAGDPTFAQFLNAVRSTVVDAFAHQQTPFERVVEALQPERNTARTPFFQTMVEMRPVGDVARDVDAVRWAPIELAERASQFTLTLHLVDDAEQGLSGNVEFDRATFGVDYVDGMVEALTHLLERIALSPTSRLSSLSCVSDAERASLLAASGVKRDYAVSGSLV
ncbi:MAG: amino acid adenylation domain-containing protein, partial [Pseudomonadota bacterium]